MTAAGDLDSLARRTGAVYAAHAHAFDRDRSRHLAEAGWLQRFAAPLPPRARVLDLGCGTGAPITGWLRRRGMRVTGVDIARPMLAIARRRGPVAPLRSGDMRTFVPRQKVHGIVSWNGFFHLRPLQQARCFRRLARLLHPGGRLMLTVGPVAGETTGHVAGEAVYHASLSPRTYRRLSRQAGLVVESLTLSDATCGGHSVLLARRRRGPA